MNILASIGKQIRCHDPAASAEVPQVISHRDKRCANESDFEVDEQESQA